MSHPEKILRTLDSHLVQPTRLILYGRAALALGFENTPNAFHATLDVDAILPEVEMAMIDADDQFWEAIDKTNAELEPSGLYMTHLFADSQVILPNDWLSHLKPVELAGLRLLKLFRPSTAGLILTKMMRVDPQDRSDIDFLLAHGGHNLPEIDILLESARVPQIPEIIEAFETNKLWLRGKFSAA